jgi:hypothetical protein
MRKRTWFVSIAAALLAGAPPANAEKKWQGQVLHMAVLGENFAGAKVILGNIEGRCAREFGDLLRQDLLGHGVMLVSEKELISAATAHHLQPTLPSSGGAPELAQALGPTDVISAEISRCQALPREPMMGTGLHFLASLRVTDLAGGSELAVLTLRADPAKQNEAQTGSPEYPGSAELVDIATRQGIEQTRHLYSPWKENQELVYMDDKECNLRESWDLLKAGDFSGLVSAARANAEGCHAAPKVASAAWYDLAIADLLLQNYDGALAAFGKSKALHEMPQAADLTAQCRRNKALAGRWRARWWNGRNRSTRTTSRRPR